MYQCCKASFTSGASDQFGFRPKCPANVLSFFNNLKGCPFLFPDNHMGPNLVGFLQDEEMGELIILLSQDKITTNLDQSIWLAAVNSTQPNLFYTMIVSLFFDASSSGVLIWFIERWEVPTICTSKVPRPWRQYTGHPEGNVRRRCMYASGQCVL
jgi:hypothetical protein